ncbi:adenosine receptor A2b isoform 2-T2 [Megaptera novaeangliae]
MCWCARRWAPRARCRRPPTTSWCPWRRPTWPWGSSPSPSPSLSAWASAPTSTAASSSPASCSWSRRAPSSASWPWPSTGTWPCASRSGEKEGRVPGAEAVRAEAESREPQGGSAWTSPPGRQADALCQPGGRAESAAEGPQGKPCSRPGHQDGRTPETRASPLAETARDAARTLVLQHLTGEFRGMTLPRVLVGDGPEGFSPRVTRYKSLVTGARARRVIAVLWVLAFGIGLTPFLGWNSKDSATNCTEPWDGTTNASCCLVKCLFENVVPMSYMVYFNFFGCVLPPLLIMLVIYVKIFLVACRQLRCMELMDHSRTVLQREIHAAKSLAVIVGIFALCWLPVHAINCATLFQPAWAKEKPKWAMNTAILLSHANSVVNPIVYAYRNRDFRCAFHQIISSKPP